MVMRSSPAWPRRSSSLPNALTENGQVGSRNTSKMRGPWPQTSGSARQFISPFLRNNFVCGLPRLRDFETRAALDMACQRADVVVGGTLKDRVLVDEARRLANPHRYAELLALGDREVDILHQNVERRAIIERTIEHRARDH